MKFDRNTVLGFVILAALFFGYFYYNSREQAAYQKQRTAELAKQDSLAKANRRPTDSLAQKTDSVNAAKTDSLNEIAKAGHFQDAARGTEQIAEVSTNFFKIGFTNKGGQPKWIELKKFKNKDSGWVKLAATEFDRIGYTINTIRNQTGNTGDFYFDPAVVQKNPDNSTAVSFTLKSSDSLSRASITHQFIVRQDEYMIDFNIYLNGANELLSQGIMNFSWQYAATQQESDLSFEKLNTQVGYVEDGDFDYHTIGKRSSKEFSDPVKWVGVRQRFFNSFLVAKNEFSSGRIEWAIPPDSKQRVVEATTNLQLRRPVVSSDSVHLSLFYGPADYNILKQYNLKMSKLVNLGQGIYAFVSPLNRFIILPVWDFIKGLVGSFGLVIAFLTLFIRLLISPLTYKSYLSGAKMKALRPEIATLKEKYGGDQQAMSMEQMKLFREAGVNPLGGCIPALLQIPIFFALYSFFNSSVDLRGQYFLWAKDLSAFDDVIHFGVHIPILGSHLSMFTITAVLTSFLISVYSMSMSPDQSNPILKYLPYIFPVFLLFIFNTLPSALTWYYTVSNIITLIMQFVIQNYIIDHDKILAKIEANRKKPKTKSKWQERLEQMQEQQKKLKEMKEKGAKSKR